jgi:hypothetical protein
MIGPSLFDMQAFQVRAESPLPDFVCASVFLLSLGFIFLFSVYHGFIAQNRRPKTVPER